MQDRVYTVWMGMIQKQQGAPPAGATTETEASTAPPASSPDEPEQLPPPQPGAVDETLVPPQPNKRDAYNKFRALVTSYKLAATMLMAPPAPGGPGGALGSAPSSGPGGGGPPSPPALNSAPEGGKH